MTPSEPIPGLGATIMFSGGSDSTLAAAIMLRQCEFVRLFTCDPGYVFFLHNSKVNARTLVQHYGADRVKHEIVDVRPLVKRILRDNLRQDWRDYGFNMTTLMCLGCRLAMHTAAIIYNLEHGIPYLADGSIRDQSNSPEQLLAVLERNRRFYRERYGIQHVSPIYEESASDQLAFELGVTKVRGLKKQFVFFDTQATCIFGVPADVYGKLFYGRAMGDQRERDSVRYLQDKHALMRQIIEEHFERTGQDLDALADRLKEKLDAVEQRA